MGKLSHLLVKEPGPSYQIDFSERVIQSVAEVVAQQTAAQFAPIVAALEQFAAGVNSETGNEVDRAIKAVQDAQKGADASLKKELSAVEKAIGKTNDAVRASSKTAESIRDRLVKALGNVKIPDYTDALENIELRQLMLAETVKEISKQEPAPREWDFDIVRNRNGFIQSVKAKAK